MNDIDIYDINNREYKIALLKNFNKIQESLMNIKIK